MNFDPLDASSAKIIVHDFGRRDPAPDDMPGEFPQVFKNWPSTSGNCYHDKGPFTLLESEAMAECSCGEKVTLVHVFKMLCTEENKMRQRFNYQHALLAQNEGKLKTKCDHCGKFSQLKGKA